MANVTRSKHQLSSTECTISLECTLSVGGSDVCLWRIGHGVGGYVMPACEELCRMCQVRVSFSDSCGGILRSGSGLRCFFFFQAEDGIRDLIVTGVQTCALPI